MQTVDRRSFISAIAGGTIVSTLSSASSSSAQAGGNARQPNVILIMTDDQGYGDLGCHGNTVIDTPNLDRLHGESTRLTDFHVDPLCAPTRASLMTGRYSARAGVWATVMGRSLLRADETTMADVFGASGYRTGIFGKWHLGDNYPFRPTDRGFQETVWHGGGGVGQAADFWGNDYFDDTYRHNGPYEKFEGYCTDVFFDQAQKFIRESRDRPFFIYLPTNAPHGPLNIADEYVKPYLDKGVPEHRARFWGMITNIDDNMGRLMATLKETGREDNTILIFLTDNGTAGGFDRRTGEGFNAGMRDGKGSPHDGGHRVPCFIRWPAGLQGGRDIDRLSAHLDLLPTFIDLCDLKRPEGVEFDGTSLAPLLTGAAEEWPDRTLVVHTQQIDTPKKWHQCAVMTQQWRLVNGKHLYGMDADPGQKQDVAGDHPETTAELRDAYEAWWSDVGQRFEEYCEIVIGAEEENPLRLCGHDWHAAQVRDIPWNQPHIHKDDYYPNGWWAIRIAQDGEYELTLRRWPEHANQPLDATQARLKIGDIELTAPVPEGATGVTFKLKLQAGSTRLQTWLIDEPKDKSRGAYYVYARRSS